MLADDAYNDDRGQSVESTTTTRRKPGQLVSGRDAGRLAAARFLADANDTHTGTFFSLCQRSMTTASSLHALDLSIRDGWF